MMLDHNWTIYNYKPSVKTCILALPGRSGTGRMMALNYLDAELDDTLIIGVTPKKLEWYPMPNGPMDQWRAVEALPLAVEVVGNVIRKIEKQYGIPQKNVAVVGFSAGAVVALQLPMYIKKPFAAIVAHGGAILEPADVPACTNKTPILMIHSKCDDCFEWEERFIPAKTALQENNYNLKTVEKEFGYHNVSACDVIVASHFLSKHLGYSKNWLHSAVR